MAMLDFRFENSFKYTLKKREKFLRFGKNFSLGLLCYVMQVLVQVYIC
jgi:hypothetical protein